MNICTNCKVHGYVNHGGRTYVACLHSNVRTVNVIRGSVSGPFANEVREDESRCGMSGKWYVPGKMESFKRWFAMKPIKSRKEAILRNPS